MPNSNVVVREVHKDDTENIVLFLCKHFTESAEVFRQILGTKWCEEAPNMGFVLEDNREVVGVYAGIYSWRLVDGKRKLFLNLAAWAVDEMYRRHSLKLLTSLVSQNIDVAFTISASGHAGKILIRRGFSVFDTGTHLFPAIGIPFSFPFRKVRLHFSISRIKNLVTEQERILIRDHLPYKCIPLALEYKSQICLIILQRRPSKFGRYLAVLYASDWSIFNQSIPVLGPSLLFRLGNPVLGVETRFLHKIPVLGVQLSRKTYSKSENIKATDIDGLYTEYVPQYSSLQRLRFHQTIARVIIRFPKITTTYLKYLLKKSVPPQQGAPDKR